MARKLIIDADPGIGDALAILVALLDPELDVVGVTATGGVVSPRVASRNLQALIAQADPSKWPRLGLSSEGPDASHDPDLSKLIQVHGPSGLGDVIVPSPDLHRQHDAAKVLIELVRQYPNGITLLTLGPLTNVAAAAERSPDFLPLLRGLVCVGGAISSGGDATAAAELNFALDPVAARNVIRGPATKTLVPLDLSEQVFWTSEQFQNVLGTPRTPMGEFLRRLLLYYFRAHHECLGREAIPLRELAAVASISRPDLLSAEPRAVDVETEGELTRGMTVCDRRRVQRPQPNIDVAQAVNVAGVLDYLSEILDRA